MSNFAQSGNMKLEERVIDGISVYNTNEDWQEHSEIVGMEVVGNTLRLQELAVPIPDNAIYYSKFAEGSGFTTADEISGVEGDLLNDASWVMGEGDGGFGIDFSAGNDAYVDTNVNGVTGSQNRTVAAWIYPFSTNTGSIIDWGVDNSDGERFTFMMNSGDLRLEVQGDGFNPISLNTNEWQFVAGVLEGDNLQDCWLYADGITENGASSDSISINTQSGDIAVGNEPSRGLERGFDGIVDSPWVANTAYSPSELDSWRNESVGNYNA